jgi:dTDP-4-dehydrorhamnose reductase
VTRWLVTGAGGMLGHDLRTVLAGEVLTALGRSSLDITDQSAVDDAVAGHDIVINAAAWTDVDGAEAHEAQATAVNGTAVGTLTQACARAGAILLHVSSDYVFPGNATAPYTEDAPTDPVNAYGRGKLVGESAVREYERGYVVRTAWLYGEHGRNFVATMLDLAARRETLDVVDDQRGQPTWSMALATRLRELGLAARDGAPAGAYHATASGSTTWFGLARAIFAEAGLDPERVRPTTSAAYVRPAVRPTYSVLGHDRWSAAGLSPMAEWDVALAQALRQPVFAELAEKARAAH